MNPENTLILSQLVNSLAQARDVFEKAYIDQDKVTFDNAKKIILEAQRRINILIDLK